MKKLSLLLLLLLLAIPVQAEVPWIRFDFFDNSGGMNNTFSPVVIEDNEGADIQNAIFTEGGAIKTRDGYDNINSSTVGSSVASTGIEFYKQADGDKFLVSVFDDDTIMKMDYQVGGGPDGTWDDITGSLSFSVDSDDLAFFAIGEDTLLIEDGIGTTAPYKWTGTGNATDLEGSPPNATMLAFHKNMAFAAGNSASPSTIYFSDIGDIENWTTGLSGNIEVLTNDGSIIRAIIPAFDSLYIFKDTSIFRLSGSDKDTFVLQEMIADIGCTSPHCASLVISQIFFTDRRGSTYIYDGANKVRLISKKIENVRDNLNANRFNKIVSFQFDDDYFVSVSNSGASKHNRVLFFDTFNLAWSLFKGINLNSATVGDNGSGKDIVFFGDYSGFVHKYPSGTNDNGSAIDFFYVTKQFRFPQNPLNKTWELVNVLASQKGNYNLNVELRNDFTSSGTTETVNLAASTSAYGSAVYGKDSYGGANLIIGRIEVGLEGQFFQIKFSNSNVDEPVQIQGYQMFIQGSEGT